MHEVLYSTSVQSVAISHARSANEVADHTLSMRWRTVHNRCFLTPYLILGSFSTSTKPVYFSIFSSVYYSNLLSFRSSTPPLMQLETISLCPIAFYLGEETDTHLATTSIQVVVECDKVFPETFFL